MIDLNRLFRFLNNGPSDRRLTDLLTKDTRKNCASILLLTIGYQPCYSGPPDQNADPVTFQTAQGVTVN